MRARLGRKMHVQDRMHMADAPGGCTWLGYPDSGFEAVMETEQWNRGSRDDACYNTHGMFSCARLGR